MSILRTSVAWNHFSDLDNFKAKCNYCKKILSYRGGGGPFNLVRHSMTVHNIPIKRPKLKPATSSRLNIINISPSSEASLATSPKTKTNEEKSTTNTDLIKKPYLTAKRIETLNQRILKVICSNYLPFSFVENEAVKELFEDVIPIYELPNADTLSNTLLNSQFQETKEEIKNRIRGIDYLSLTTDLWTSKSNARFMSLTCHFVDSSNTELKSFTLGCSQLTETKTWTNLPVKIMEMCEDYDITERVVGITTDNGCNLRNDQTLSSFQQIFCLADTLNLVVQKGLLSISDTQAKIRDIVQFFRKGSIGAQKLENEQKMIYEEQLELKQEDKSRWISTFHMFQRVIEVQTSLKNLMACEYQEMPQITGEDLNIISSACDLLSFFEQASTEMCEETKIPISKYLLLSRALILNCEKVMAKKAMPSSVKKMAEIMVKDLKSRLEDIERNSIVTESIILDPRFKKYGFSNTSSYESALEEFKQKLGSDSETDNEISSVEQKGNYSSLWSFFDIEIEKDERSKITGTGVAELDLYLLEPLLRRDKDPLEWWEKRKLIYPRLYELVKQRFCIMATAVPSTVLFSKRGQAMTNQRSLLDGDTVEKLVFLNYNM